MAPQEFVRLVIAVVGTAAVMSYVLMGDARPPASNTCPSVAISVAPTPAPTVTPPPPPRRDMYEPHHDVDFGLLFREKCPMVPRILHRLNSANTAHVNVPLLYSVAGGVQRSLAMACQAPDAPTNIPVFAAALMPKDFFYMVRTVGRIDTGVMGYHFILNGESKEANDFLLLLTSVFREFMTFSFDPSNLGFSGSVNTILRSHLVPTGGADWVMYSNADAEASPGYYAQYARHMHENLHKRTFHSMGAFLIVCFTREGLRRHGYMDEAIYPAYVEDIELSYRMRALGVEIDSFPGGGAVIHHGDGSASAKGDGKVKKILERWNRHDYFMRKWGSAGVKHSGGLSNPAFATPFDVPTFPVTTWFIDPVHRMCIQTGAGPKIRDAAGKPTPACYYNVTATVGPHAPPGHTFPDWMTSLQEAPYHKSMLE